MHALSASWQFEALCGDNHTGFETMHEQTKINEAKYFLAQMTALVNDRIAFNYNLSAFLAAARSALQYAYEEAKPQSNGQPWYNGQVAGKAVVEFFRDKRNVSIHAHPVSPHATIRSSVSQTIGLTESVLVTIDRKDGSTEQVRTPSSLESPPSPTEAESSVAYEYFFSDWSGSDDVLQLCHTYISDVEAIVFDGVTSGYLTPS